MRFLPWFGSRPRFSQNWFSVDQKQFWSWSGSRPGFSHNWFSVDKKRFWPWSGSRPIFSSCHSFLISFDELKTQSGYPVVTKTPLVPEATEIKSRSRLPPVPWGGCPSLLVRRADLITAGESCASIGIGEMILRVILRVHRPRSVGPAAPHAYPQGRSPQKFNKKSRIFRYDLVNYNWLYLPNSLGRINMSYCDCIWETVEKVVFFFHIIYIT